jgi:hypothetical protein
MKVHVTVVYEYEIPDDLEEREEAYGTTDPEACLAMDLEYGLEEVANYAMIVHTETAIVN